MELGALSKRLLIIPPLLLGAGLLFWLTQGRTGPEQAEIAEVARPVRVIEVQPTDYVPRALGYGYVQPGAVWEAVAEVAGKIVYRHPDLERGQIIDAGAVILKIDPKDYELARERIEAELESAAAQLAELGVREENAKALLEIERQSLGLAQKDLERKQSLRKTGNASQTSVDQADNAVLAQRQKVQDMENQLNLIPAEQRLLEADRALQRTKLQESERDLERTVIRMPIEARIAEVNVEAQQFASVNQRLVVADSVDVAEISAQMAVNHVRPLVRAGLSIESLAPGDLPALSRRMNFTALVRFRMGGSVVTWDARFDRVSDTMDPKTRTIGFIVVVDEPYLKLVPGERPPLVKNMYVEVELRAPVRPGQIVVPRVSVADGPDGVSVVYLVGEDNRLLIKPVKLGAVQSDFAVVEEGLSGGERVVVSDLVPAIEGMLLRPSVDEALAARLIEQASGATSVR